MGQGHCARNTINDKSDATRQHDGNFCLHAVCQSMTPWPKEITKAMCKLRVREKSMPQNMERIGKNAAKRQPDANFCVHAASQFIAQRNHPSELQTAACKHKQQEHGMCQQCRTQNTTNNMNAATRKHDDNFRQSTKRAANCFVQDMQQKRYRKTQTTKWQVNDHREAMHRAPNVTMTI